MRMTGAASPPIAFNFISDGYRPGTGIVLVASCIVIFRLEKPRRSRPLKYRKSHPAFAPELADNGAKAVMPHRHIFLRLTTSHDTFEDFSWQRYFPLAGHVIVCQAIKKRHRIFLSARARNPAVFDWERTAVHQLREHSTSSKRLDHQLKICFCLPQLEAPPDGWRTYTRPIWTNFIHYATKSVGTISEGCRQLDRSRIFDKLCVSNLCDIMPILVCLFCVVFLDRSNHWHRAS